MDFRMAYGVYGLLRIVTMLRERSKHGWLR